MGSLTDQLHALQIPPELRHGPSEQLDAHIRRKILVSLGGVPGDNIVNADGQDLLATLDPFDDSLAYLHVLLSHIQGVSGKAKAGQAPKQFIPGGEIWQKIVHFVNTFDSLQIRYAGRMWLEFVNILVQMATLGRADGMTAAGLLARAMVQLDPTCGTFTTSHLDLIRSAVNSHSYRDALPVLDRDIHSLPSKTGLADIFPCSGDQLSSAYITIDSHLTDKIDRNDVLEYYLLGAMCYIGVKQWSSAQYFLEHVLATPTTNAGSGTGLMLEAYKKWILVVLMANGRTGGSPRGASGNVIKSLRPLAKVYESIAEAFGQSDRKKLMAEVHEAQKLIHEDRNAGLVQQVLDQHQKLSVRRLAKVYTAVPMTRVCSEYNQSAQAMERYLQALITEGQLDATIEDSTKGKVLRFNQDRQLGATSEAQSRAAISEQARKLELLAAHVQEADRQLSLSKDYLDHTYAKQKSGRGRNGLSDEGLVVFEGRPPSDGDEDENMMMDMR